jgi:hypothetical protein
MSINPKTKYLEMKQYVRTAGSGQCVYMNKNKRWTTLGYGNQAVFPFVIECFTHRSQCVCLHPYGQSSGFRGTSCLLSPSTVGVGGILSTQPSVAYNAVFQPRMVPWCVYVCVRERFRPVFPNSRPPVHPTAQMIFVAPRTSTSDSTCQFIIKPSMSVFVWG